MLLFECVCICSCIRVDTLEAFGCVARSPFVFDRCLQAVRAVAAAALPPTLHQQVSGGREPRGLIWPKSVLKG